MADITERQLREIAAIRAQLGGLEDAQGNPVDPFDFYTAMRPIWNANARADDPLPEITPEQFYNTMRPIWNDNALKDTPAPPITGVTSDDEGLADSPVWGGVVNNIPNLPPEMQVPVDPTLGDWRTGSGQPPTPPAGPPSVPLQWQNYAEGPSPNDAFYQQQAEALQGQNAQLMQQQAQANAIRANRPAQQPFDRSQAFDWLEGGLPEVQVAGGSTNPATGEVSRYMLSDLVTPGMSNYDVVQALGTGGKLNPQTQAIMGEYFAGAGDQNQNNWARGTRIMSPEAFMSSHSDGSANWSPEFRGAMQDVANALFTDTRLATPPGGGPSAAPGYALPVPVGG